MTQTGNKNIGDLSIKDIFNRKGGNFAKFTAVLMGGGLIYGLLKAAPFILAATTSLLMVAIEAVALIAIIMVLTSKKFWKWISLFWMAINRMIISAFVKIDPISILEDALYKMRNKHNEVKENIDKLSSILVQMKKRHESYQQEKDENIAKLKKLSEIIKNIPANSDDFERAQGQAVTLGNDIARVEDIMKSQIERINISEKYLKVMKRLEIRSANTIEDNALKLRRMKEDYEAAKAETSAINSISDILNGGTKTLEEELAAEYISNTINMSIAKMDRFLNDSSSVLMDDDLNTAVNMDKVNKILSKYDQDNIVDVVDIPYIDAADKQQDLNTINKQPNLVPVKKKYF